MSKQKKAIIILSVACAVLVLLLVGAWNRMRWMEEMFSKQVSGLHNGIPFCMKVASAYVNGDAEQIVQLSRSKDAAKFPHLADYADLDLEFSGLDFPPELGGGEGIGTVTIRYRLLSDIPPALAEEIPQSVVEHRDGKDYIYQIFTALYEHDRLEEENLGWSYKHLGFNGTPFSHSGDQTNLSHYANP